MISELCDIMLLYAVFFLIYFAGNGSQMSEDETELEPLELVWAKCRGYPSYPALVILHSAQMTLNCKHMMGSYQLKR